MALKGETSCEFCGTPITEENCLHYSQGGKEPASIDSIKSGDTMVYICIDCFKDRVDCNEDVLKQLKSLFKEPVSRR